MVRYTYNVLTVQAKRNVGIRLNVKHYVRGQTEQERFLFIPFHNLLLNLKFYQFKSFSSFLLPKIFCSAHYPKYFPWTFGVMPNKFHNPLGR